MSTLTITEFLEARITEDEALAKAAIADDSGQDGGFEDAFDRLTGRSGGLDFTPRFGDAAARMIVWNTPRRVLAECGAKRAIIKQHEGWPVLVERKPEFSEDTTDPQRMAYRVTQEMVWLTEREYVKRFGVEAPTTNMIRALAAVYKDHTDYQEDWAL